MILVGSLVGGRFQHVSACNRRQDDEYDRRDCDGGEANSCHGGEFYVGEPCSTIGALLAILVLCGDASSLCSRTNGGAAAIPSGAKTAKPQKTGPNGVDRRATPYDLN
jgi:hypothetical protein